MNLITGSSEEFLLATPAQIEEQVNLKEMQSDKDLNDYGRNTADLEEKAYASVLPYTAAF